MMNRPGCMNVGKSVIGGVVLVVLAFVVASPAAAAPIYVSGNTAPVDLTGSNRQYRVDAAIAAVYDPDVANIQGTNAEANLYLNSAAAQAAPTTLGTGWGTGWVGLGETGDSGLGVAGFTGSAQGSTSGSFNINTSVLDYDQFAVAIKDGGAPKWAIFLLPVGTTASNWSFLSSGGALSHYAVFGRNVPQGPETGVVPGPSGIVLALSGLIGFGITRVRAFRRRATA